MTLDIKGRCCGRKPIEYRKGLFTDLQVPHKFCPRCDRAYRIDNGEQIRNWAWEQIPGTKQFQKRRRDEDQ